MAFIQTKSSSENISVNIFYQQYGTGNPVIFIHGWPLNSDMWEYQFTELPNHNMRCIAYDRRGFGKSDRTWVGYDYDTLADDLNELISQLQLTDVTLVGFSMGGGEVARYIGKYGSDKISKIVFISSVTPFRLKTNDNPEGTEKSTFDATIEKLKADRPAFLAEFGKKFYGVSASNEAVSNAVLDWNQMLCLNSSPKATMDCVRSFSETDFRADLEKIKVPVLIIHGDNDTVVPIELSGDKTAKIIAHASYIIYPNAPHGLFITDKEKLNTDLINFINTQV
jgi:non-heme chloroperoxidase